MVFDLVLFSADDFHVTIDDAGDDTLPRSPRLHRILFLYWRDFDGGGRVFRTVEDLDLPPGFPFTNREFTGPLSLNRVQHVFLPSFRVKSSGKRSPLPPPQPSPPRVVNFSNKPRGRPDVTAFAQLDAGGSSEEAFDVQGRKGDVVGFIILGEVEEGVAGLIYVDGVGEGGFWGGGAG